jgi:2-polyprenyl-3-methyl-5-hydroxy-6-metoxy-1,4-benzoquinol methylase
MDSTQIEYDKKVADYWDQHTDQSFYGETYWLANPSIARRFNSNAVGGREYESWVNFCVQHFLGNRLPVERVLTIGCGDGVLDRHLASINTAKLIEGIDIAPNRIEIAKQMAAQQGMQEVIKYTLCNAETTDFPSAPYDAIFFNSALHHMSELESLLQRCANSIKRRGYLFVNEYIGPNRFAFSEREKQVMQAAFQLIPEKYRISHADHDRGKVRSHLAFPDPVEVSNVDPSEAIRSEEIVSILEQYFDIIEFNIAGGTLQQYLLSGIAGNFQESDPDSLQVLELIFQIEETLVASGDIAPHFALIVAKPKGLIGKLKARYFR